MTAAERRKKMLEQEALKFRGRSTAIGMVSPTVKRHLSSSAPATPPNVQHESTAHDSDDDVEELVAPIGAVSTEGVSQLLRERADSVSNLGESATMRELRMKGITTDFDPTPRKPTPIAPSEVLSDDERRKAFVFQSAPKGTTVQMYIRRDRSGLKKFYPEYQLFFKEQVCTEILIVGVDHQG